jgi:hypothetical protein
MKIQNGDELRDATAEEEAFIRKTQSDAEAAQHAAEQRRQQRSEILSRLGLSQEEVELMLGGL